MAEAAIIVGMSGTTGLAVVRALTGAGVDCHAVHFRSDAPPMTTRLARVHVCADWREEPDTLVDFLVALAADVGPASLSVCHDAALGPVWAGERRLREAGLRPAFSAAGRLDELLDKRVQMEAAERAGVPVPRTRWGAAAELAAAAADYPYPVIVKPVVSHVGVPAIRAKAIVCRTPDEVRSVLASVGDLEVLVQELVPGGDEELYTAGVFVCDGGYLAYTGRKLKQHPPLLGTARLTETVDVPELVPGSVRLLHELGYQGVAQVEYKRDPRDGSFRLMEVNLRPWRWIGLATASGVNLPLAAHRWALTGLPPVETTGKVAGGYVSDRPQRWIWALAEARYTARGLLHGRLPQLALWRGVRAEAFFARNDPSPFLHEVTVGVGAGLRRLHVAVRKALYVPAAAVNGAVLWTDWRRARRTSGAVRPAIGALPRGPLLVLAPHPDDETIMCGATAALLRDRGEAVRIVGVTAGAATGVGAGDEVTTARTQELRAAAAALGVDDVVMWDFDDRRLAAQRRQLVERVAAVLEEYRPAWVVTPFPYDAHHDHVAVAMALADALRGGAPPPAAVLGAPVQTPLSPEWATRLVPAGAGWARKRAAMRAYRSRDKGIFVKPLQLAWLHPAYPLRPAEQFVELPPEAFVRLAQGLEEKRLTAPAGRSDPHPLAAAVQLARTRPRRRRVAELIAAARRA